MNPSLEKITRILTRRHQTITCAESCTDGLLAGALTSVVSSSRWFHQSFVTYNNKTKGDRLGMMLDTLLKCGAVNRKTVCEMARGTKTVAGADYALSVSGIAGPNGGSAVKPVGTIWFGLTTPIESLGRTALFEGDRESICNQVV